MRDGDTGSEAMLDAWTGRGLACMLDVCCGGLGEVLTAMFRVRWGRRCRRRAVLWLGGGVWTRLSREQDRFSLAVGKLKADRYMHSSSHHGDEPCR